MADLQLDAFSSRNVLCFNLFSGSLPRLEDRKSQQFTSIFRCLYSKVLSPDAGGKTPNEASAVATNTRIFFVVFLLTSAAKNLSDLASVTPQMSVAQVCGQDYCLKTDRTKAKTEKTYHRSNLHMMDTCEISGTMQKLCLKHS